MVDIDNIVELNLTPVLDLWKLRGIKYGARYLYQSIDLHDVLTKINAKSVNLD